LSLYQYSILVVKAEDPWKTSPLFRRSRAVVLIGLSASFLLLATGRIAASAASSQNLHRGRDDRLWRLVFIAGLIGGCFAVRLASGDAFPVSISASTPELVVAGFCVGLGTRFATVVRAVTAFAASLACHLGRSPRR